MKTKTPRIAVAMAEANRLNKPPRSVTEWAEEFGISRTYVYAVAESLGLSRFFHTPPQSARTGTMAVRPRETKYGTNPAVILPVRAIREAGFDQYKTLKYTAEPGKIIIEKAVSP